MIVIHNHLGGIEFTRSFFETLTASTAVKCFGVSAMNASTPAERLAEIVPPIGRAFDIKKGVNVKIHDKKVFIAIHISIMYGVNANAVVSSIKNKLRYAIEEQTRMPVEKIDVYIDGLTH